MSQFGMQMPSKARRGSSPDVYSALIVLAAIALAVACVVMWFAASKVGKGGNAFGLQDTTKIEFANAAK